MSGRTRLPDIVALISAPPVDCETTKLALDLPTLTTRFNVLPMQEISMRLLSSVTDVAVTKSCTSPGSSIPRLTLTVLEDNKKELPITETTIDVGGSRVEEVSPTSIRDENDKGELSVNTETPNKDIVTRLDAPNLAVYEALMEDTVNWPPTRLSVEIRAMEGVLTV
jgi:hypothetical protein